MLKFICSFVFTLGIFCAYCQDSSGFIAEDVEEANRNAHNLCQPGVLNKSRSKGVEISYRLIHKGEFEQASGSDFLERESKLESIKLLNFKLKMPILLKPGLKIIAGYAYSPEFYSFKNIDSEYGPTLQRLNDRVLKNNSFSLTITKPINKKIYAALRLKTSYRGDYGGWMNFDSRYGNQNLVALVGFKKDDFTEIAGGITYSRGAYNSRVIPFLVVNKTFNHKWGLETVLPGKIMGRYNFDRKSLVLFGAEYNSGSFSIDGFDMHQNDFTAFDMKHSEIRASISLEKQIVPWIWSNIKFGYQKNFNTKFNNQISGATAFELNRSNPVFFQIGIFVSPPGGCM